MGIRRNPYASRVWKGKKYYTAFLRLFFYLELEKHKIKKHYGVY